MFYLVVSKRKRTQSAPVSFLCYSLEGTLHIVCSQCISGILLQRHIQPVTVTATLGSVFVSVGMKMFLETVLCLYRKALFGKDGASMWTRPKIWHTASLLFTNLISYVVVQHADHRCSFAVGDGVKNFIHLWWMAHIHLKHKTSGKDNIIVMEPVMLTYNIL